MAELTERIELTSKYRELLLKYGYVSGCLDASLRRWPKDQPIRRVRMARVELEWLIGDLSHSCVKGKVSRDVEVIADLCDYLEYAQQTGVDDLEIGWQPPPQ